MSKKRITGIVFVSIAGFFLVMAAISKAFSSISSNGFVSFFYNLSSVNSFIFGLPFLIVGIVLIIKGKNVIKQPPSEIAVQLKSQLPPSATPLTKKNLKKIYQLFPVPTDYEILWAEVQSFGNHPAGIVITNEALILKSPKSEIKRQNKEIKRENKGKKKTERKAKIPYVYRIIPWQYFSPDEYKFVSDKSGKQHHFVIDESTVFRIETPELFNSFVSIQQSYSKVEQWLSEYEVSSVNAAINTINVEPAIYMAKNGAANSTTGHGIIAEDVGTVIEKLHGIDATVVGRDNAANGPDKLVNIDGTQTAVQCKYCISASESVGACFENGIFRYYDLNGNPMKIEVPKDQYPKAIDEMRSMISSGKVPGVTDPEKATDIIRKGSLTYEQARNLAKAGTFESITYDAATATVRCLSVFGISFLFVFAQVFWETKDVKQAAKSALITGAKVYGLSIIGSVISSQLSRAGIENLFYPMMKNVLDKLPDSFVQRMAANTKGLVRPEAVVVDGARNYYARFLSSQVSATCIMFLVFSAPDIYRVISNNISSGQFVMNMAERFAGTVAGSVSGSVIGSIVGNAINPFVGGVAGFGAGVIVGTGASYLTKTIAHLFREDDNVIVSRLFTAVLINTAMDYTLSQAEQEKLIKLLEQDKKNLSRLQKKLIKSRTQSKDIRKYLLPKIKSVTNDRKLIKASDEYLIKQDVDDIVSKGELCYEM